MKRLLLVTLAACFAAMSFVTAQAASTPNVIIIMADDQGYQDLGCFGSSKIKTPPNPWPTTSCYVKGSPWKT